jgi:hypothetical protein
MTPAAEISHSPHCSVPTTPLKQLDPFKGYPHVSVKVTFILPINFTYLDI